jgi:hypothetical protein
MTKLEKQVRKNAYELDKIINDGLYILYCDNSLGVYPTAIHANEAGKKLYKDKGFVIRKVISDIPIVSELVRFGNTISASNIITLDD